MDDTCPKDLRREWGRSEEEEPLFLEWLWITRTVGSPRGKAAGDLWPSLAFILLWQGSLQSFHPSVVDAGGSAGLQQPMGVL